VSHGTSITEAEDRLRTYIANAKPGDDLDLINWHKGYMGRGGQAAVRRAVRSGQIVKRRGSDFHYTRASQPGAAPAPEALPNQPA
jgi:hypothetical protein